MIIPSNPTFDFRPVFGEVIARLLDGDMKDMRGTHGRTYIEQLAYQMFLDPTAEAKATAIADARARGLPELKAAVDRAKALNAPKQAIMDLAERCEKRGGYQLGDYKPGQVAFHFDLPYVLVPLDKRYGPHVYMPCNRDYAPLGELGKMTGGPFWHYDDHSERAWHFRRDPREIEGAWLGPPNVLYLYGLGDKIEHKSDRAFMENYRKRLRLALAEALPGIGGLNPEW